MELTLKNELAAKILNYGKETYNLSPQKLQKLNQRLVKENRTEESENLIVGGYLMELLGAAQQAGCDFGFTYDTVKTLSTALAAQFKQ